MQKRLYFILILFLISFTIYAITGWTHEKVISVQYSQLTKDAQKQVDCLAQNIYHEAGWEPEKGKIAVALVTMNRVQDDRFGKDICSVVKQKTNTVCQFSWFCEGKKLITNNFVYDQARDIALYVYANYEKINDFTQGALYYHADYVNPRWKLEKTTVIGRHIFYKEKVVYDDEQTKHPIKR